MFTKMIVHFFIFVSALLIVSGFLIILVFNKKPDPKIVAVIDTGLDFHNPDFKGKFIKGFNFVDWSNNPVDDNGHGTHSAGTISKESPHSKLLIIKSLNRKGYDPNIATGLSLFYVLFTHASVVNMSFNSTNPYLESLAIRLGEMKGIIYVAAAGNQGKKQLSPPSNIKCVISVGAYNSFNQHAANFSNYSPKVSFVEPGVNIESDYLNDTKVDFSGTSMAAAYTTGTIAYLKIKHPSLNQSEITHFLNQNAFTFNYHYPTKSFNYNKIRALVDQYPYFWVEKPTNKSNSNLITIHYEALHDPALFVYNNGIYLTSLNPNSNEKTLNLSYGQHDLMFIDTKANSVYDEQVFIAPSK